MTRLDPEKRRDQILETAYKLAIALGYNNVHAGTIANKLCISRTLVQHHFTSAEIEEGVLMLGLTRENVEIAVQIIRGQHHLEHAIPDAVRKKAIDKLFGKVKKN